MAGWRQELTRDHQSFQPHPYRGYGAEIVRKGLLNTMLAPRHEQKCERWDCLMASWPVPLLNCVVGGRR